MTFIAPDTKDWTWVLRRRCPECGFDAGQVGRDQVIPSILELGRSWEAVLRRPHITVRPASNRWSALEYGCHVRDVFRLFEVRLALMLTERDPVFENWDQDATAVADRYQERDPAIVSEELAQAATAIAGRFRGLTEEDWQRGGTRSDGARFSVESFARYLLHDPTHHLWDVSAAQDPPRNDLRTSLP